MEATTMIVEWVLILVLALLVHSYVIYPTLAILIGAGRVTYLNEQLPTVSILVPAHNEAAVIEDKIRNFLEIDYPEELLELIIADDGSVDGTPSIVKSHVSERIRLIENESRHGKAATMNRMVEMAHYPLLLFSDANVLLAKNAVRRLVDHMSNPRVGAVTGEVKLQGSAEEFSSGEELYYRIERRIQSAESRIGSVMGVDGGMYMVRRSLYKTIAADTILDDFLVSIHVMRARRQVTYETAAMASESGTPSAKQEFQRRARIAAGAVQLFKRGNLPRISQPILWFQFVSHKFIRWVSPILIGTLFLANILTYSINVWYRMALLAQLFLVAAILLCWAITPLRRTTIGGIIFYFGISQVAMAVGLIRGVLNRQRPQWEKTLRVNRNSPQELSQK